MQVERNKVNVLYTEVKLNVITYQSIDVFTLYYYRVIFDFRAVK